MSIDRERRSQSAEPAQPHGAAAQKRRPRFRRAAPAAYRVTDGDIAILELLARHRFLRSTHIAALAGRSLDRTNDRLRKLFDGGLVDRPRAQLDRYPDAGSAPMVYALADDGARRLAKQDGGPASTGRSRRNEDAGRPFIEHQLAIADFLVALELAVRHRSDLRLISQDELSAEIAVRGISGHPFKLSVSAGDDRLISVIPDLAFGLRYKDGSRRCFLVEIDRGTMPIIRRDAGQTSLARKLRTYLAAIAEGEHERRFGWKTLRVLIVTTTNQRLRSAQAILKRVSTPPEASAQLLLFATMETLRRQDPIGAFVDFANHAQSLA